MQINNPFNKNVAIDSYPSLLGMKLNPRTSAITTLFFLILGASAAGTGITFLLFQPSLIGTIGNVSLASVGGVILLPSAAWMLFLIVRPNSIKADPVKPVPTKPIAPEPKKIDSEEARKERLKELKKEIEKEEQKKWKSERDKVVNCKIHTKRQRAEMLKEAVKQNMNEHKIFEGFYLANENLVKRKKYGDKFESISRKYGIKHVLRAKRDEVYRGKSPLKFYDIDLIDHGLDKPKNTKYRENFHNNLGKAFQFIEEGREAGGVVVHCTHGIVRSASTVIAYLMWKYKVSFKQAENFVFQQRPRIDVTHFKTLLEGKENEQFIHNVKLEDWRT